MQSFGVSSFIDILLLLLVLLLPRTQQSMRVESLYNGSCFWSRGCSDGLYFFYDNKYLLLTEFEGRTVSYGPSFFLLNLWPKREARGP